MAVNPQQLATEHDLHQAITQMGREIEMGPFLVGPRLLSIESLALLKTCGFH
jgi:hypothetical protein